MNVEEEQSRSLWMDLPPIEVPVLADDLTTDVLVVGAGIAGLSTAYELALSGRKVTVVDRGRPALGMSARTSAHLACEIDDFNCELIKVHDVAAAQIHYTSQRAAIDRVEQIVADEGIDCDFARVDGYFVPAKAEDVAYLRQEFDASVQAGFGDAEWLERGPGPWALTPAIRYPRQARFHPLRYLYGLLAVLRARGVEVYGHTAVVSLDEQSDHVVAQCGQGPRIRASAVVAATNSPFHLRIPIHTKQAPYRTYVIAAPVPKDTVPDTLVWDTLEPGYHYVRIQPGAEQDVVIVGGEDHKTGERNDMEQRFAALERWTRARFPMLGTVTHRWSGQVLEPADYLPFIGRSPQHERVWLVTGDSGQGLTTAVAASMILREQVNGGTHPWGRLYEPSRKMLHGLREYLTENLDASRHWAAHLGKGDVESLDQVQPGHGGIVKLDGEAVAAYRTPDGELRLLDATCTHAGCVVRWNDFERCWDCPCHGSQFATDGEPLQGPANRPLALHERRASVRQRAAND
ncbi:MAG TPA: FAD-dependent oxidoreductase [Steroidobacteraceae bacterium]|nr:FAD-dependent oxidoreductase [Steroidobacteraceae bacterium]